MLPVAILARAPLFLAVNANVPGETFDEFIRYARARQGELNYGSSGVGSVVTSVSSNNTFPSDGVTSPEMMLSSVVLPHPDGPSNA